MQQSQWQLQTAKAQLSQVFDAALHGEPQRITRRGKDAVVMVSESTYLALQHNAKAAAPDFLAHLLAMPKEPVSAIVPPPPMKVALRDIDL
jgi:antitoxin Phd